MAQISDRCVLEVYKFILPELFQGDARDGFSGEAIGVLRVLFFPLEVNLSWEVIFSFLVHMVVTVPEHSCPRRNHLLLVDTFLQKREELVLDVVAFHHLFRQVEILLDDFELPVLYEADVICCRTFVADGLATLIDLEAILELAVDLTEHRRRELPQARNGLKKAEEKHLLELLLLL